MPRPPHPIERGFAGSPVIRSSFAPSMPGPPAPEGARSLQRNVAWALEKLRRAKKGLTARCPLNHADCSAYFTGRCSRSQAACHPRPCALTLSLFVVNLTILYLILVRLTIFICSRRTT